MTERLYYSDKYAKEITATVTGVDGRCVRLDRTIFYPEAGGQPGDRGFFGSFRIADTKKSADGDVLHVIDGNGPMPAVGDFCTLSLDWPHRYFFMKEHTAQHLVSAILFSSFSIGTVAVHQGDEFFTVETDRGEIDEDTLLRVEDAANEAIRKNLKVWQDETDHESAEKLHMRRSIKVAGRVMLVHIEGIDVVACGGVHVSSLSEIGEIAYVSSEKIRGHVRTCWKCSDSAVRYRRENAAIVRKLSSLFSAEPGCICREAERCLSEIRVSRHNLSVMSGKLASYLFFSACEETNGSEAVIFSTELDVSAFESVIPEDYPRPVLVMDEEGRFLFHGQKELFEAFRNGVPGLRGGGRGMRFRGSFQGDTDQFAAAVRKILDGNGST